MITVWPAPIYQGRNPRISSGYGMRKSKGGKPPKMHKGVDIMYKRIPGDPCPPKASRLPHCSPGNYMPSAIPALALADGVVTISKEIGTGGYVKIRHAGGLDSQYLHLKNRRVKVGDTVVAGQPVGQIWYNTSPDGYHLAHLHFQLRRNGALIDPRPFLRKLDAVENPWRYRGLKLLAGIVVVGAIGGGIYYWKTRA